MDKKQFLNYLKKGGNPYLNLPYNKEEIGLMIKIMNEFFNLIIDDKYIGYNCVEIPYQLIIREYPVAIYIDSLAQL